MDRLPMGRGCTGLESFYVYIVRTSTETPLQPLRYTVTKEGVEASARFPTGGLVRIGRQQTNEHGERPNDIVLPPSDRAISRIHCQINYQAFFPGLVPVSPEWIAFLMASHPRLGRNSHFFNLPEPIYRYILGFLKELPKLTIIDLGSICGTYVRVLNDKPVELHPGQYFLIGSDVLIEILEISDIMEFRLNEPGMLEETIHTEQLGCRYAPGLRININKQQEAEENTISADENQFEAFEKQEIKIGRSTASNIVISDSTISRIQCRITFENSRWWLFDGLIDRPSVNGTWLSICDKDKGFRQVSKPYELTRGAEVKISETVVRVDWD